MNNTHPLVSVLMTAYNREKYIGEAIDSVLASSYGNIELIIVDDCSGDGTVKIARNYEAKDLRVRVYVNEKNLGDYENRNRAASYANGKYIKYVDSDDLIYPHGLAVMVEAMEKYPEAGVGISSLYPQEERPFPFLLGPAESYHTHFFIRGTFDTGPAGLIFNTEKFRQIGGFSGKRYIGDIEINLRLAAKWPVAKIASSLIYWRKHDGQEYVIGNASTGYLELLLPMYREELNKPECPLDPDQRRMVINHFRKISARNILNILLKKKDSRLAMKMYRKLSLGPGDLFNAALFMKKNNLIKK
jgi:glycosyltransferase involved in cell wall biosynthesis